MVRVTTLASLLLIVGCTAAPPTARINDVSLPHSEDLGYRVMAVDGKEVTRAAGNVATVVPVALVPIGEHVFTVRHRDDGTVEQFTAVVAADKEYRVAIDARNKLTLVEHPSSRP